MRLRIFPLALHSRSAAHAGVPPCWTTYHNTISVDAAVRARICNFFHYTIENQAFTLIISKVTGLFVFSYFRQHKLLKIFLLTLFK